MQTEDIKRLQIIANNSSSLGEKLSRLLVQTLKFTGSKVGLVIGGVVLSGVFFLLGFLGRRK